MKDNSKKEWTEVITAQNSWFTFNLTELWRYRDLILLFVHRDFVSVYKQTILGPLWHLIQPLFTTVIFTIVFGGIAQISTDGQPAFLFYLSGVTIWNYFSNNLIKTSGTFINNAGIFGKVYFPRLTVPISIVISGLFSFGIQLFLFLIFYFYYFLIGVPIHFQIIGLILIPVLVLEMAILGLGLGIIVSALTTKYRDLNYLVAFGTQLLMYASPIIYPASAIGEKYRWLIWLNPITPVVEAFRYCFFGNSSLDLITVFYSFLFTVLIFLIGVALFNRVEKTFMDTI